MATKKKGSTGNRYTPAERKTILAFIAKQGRGGIAAAQKKWGVSYVALRRWMDKGGKRGRKPGKAASTRIKGLKGVISALRKALERLEALT